MPSLCLYFQVHQPYRLRCYSVFDSDANYFDDEVNGQIMAKVAEKCYRPANALMLELIKRYQGKFRIAYSITGVAVEQFQRYAPDVLESFKALARSGCVEFLGETYHHTLSFLYSKREFLEQVRMHREMVEQQFGQTPTVFRNTELIYNDQLPALVGPLGFTSVLAEGADHVLGWRSANHVYTPREAPHLALLLKNYRLSDDVAFRFSDCNWNEWPLTAEKFVEWINRGNGNGDTVNLFMDYETFGEHQWADTGIFEFLRALPAQLLGHPDNDFLTPSEVVASHPRQAEISMPDTVSWADLERDLSAWLGNAMQSNALHEIYRLESAILSSEQPGLIDDWRKLQTSDHFYYMCTKYFSDGDVHKYFNPYDSPYDSYINYMNVMDNIRSRMGRETALTEAAPIA